MTSVNIDEADMPMFTRSAKAEIGYIYCLSNPAMPGLVKIGYTNRNARVRAFELSFGTRDSSATGVPLPFDVVKDWRVPGDRAEQIEQQIHRALHQHRVPSHGRVKPKEFFYFEPAQAVLAIERTLQAMDWWAASQAEEARFQQEVAEREARHVAEAARERVLADAEQKVKEEIAIKQAAWQQDVIRRKADEGLTVGLKWGALWFGGSWLIFAMMGSKDSIGWFCLALGAFVCFINRDGPANEYLSSQGARDEMDKIEAEIRRRFVQGQSNGVDRSVVPVAPLATSSRRQQTEHEIAKGNFPQRFAAAAILIKKQDERARLIRAGNLKPQLDLRERPVPVKMPSQRLSSTPGVVSRAPLATSSNQTIAAKHQVQRVGFACPNCRAELKLEQQPENVCVSIRCPTCNANFPWADYINRGVRSRAVPVKVPWQGNPAPISSAPIAKPVAAKVAVPVPVLKKFKAVCPKCKLVLAARMEAPDLSRKILCPSCSNVFLFGERSMPNRVQREPGNDMDSLYRDFE